MFSSVSNIISEKQNWLIITADNAEKPIFIQSDTSPNGWFMLYLPKESSLLLDQSDVVVDYRNIQYWILFI